VTAHPIAVTASPVPVVRFALATEPSLSIVIVTYGTGVVLDRCLTDLARALDEDGLDAEVIVVDNPHPVRGTWAGDRVRLTTEGIRVVRPPDNLGFGGGNNVGVAVARADRVCLLNPDVFLAPGQLARLVGVAEQWPADIVAPGLFWPDGTPQEFGFRVLANGETRAVTDPAANNADYASAACWVLSKQVFASLGGFDEIFHPAYYEDVDFVFRARREGHELRIVDDVHVIHAAHSTTTSGWDADVPDAGRQRAIFVERWAHVLSGRPTA
jgi:GT2 family glycosyltransferase